MHRLPVLVLSCLSLSAAIALATPPAAPHTTPQSAAKPAVVNPLQRKVIGTWLLVAATPVSMMDSDPRGLLNHKSFYRADGRLFMFAPDRPLTVADPSLPFRIEGATRIVTLPDGKESRAGIAIDGDVMRITMKDKRVLTYRRVLDQRPLDAAFAPISVESVTMPETRPPEPRYDMRDYSRLPVRERIRGIWEAVRYRRVRSDEMPTNGFPNDKYVVTDRLFSMSAPDEAHVDPQRTGTYRFINDHQIVIGEGADAATWSVSFDQWGRLVIEQPEAEVTLRLITRATNTVPPLPLRIALLEPAEEK
jgi:hypothetical protein